MADQVPVKSNTSAGVTTSLQQYESGDTTPVVHGGTGLANIAADSLLYTSALNTLAATSLTAFGRSLIDDADAAAARTTLGLGTAATQDTGTSGTTVPLLSTANTWSANQEFTTIGASGLISADGGQVAFPATQNPSADANTLDDYEEGTWTPVVVDDSVAAGEGQTYTTQTGYYTKIGQHVHLEGRITMSSLGSLNVTQQVQIAAFPFTIRNTGNAVGSFVINQASGLSLPAAGSVPSGRPLANTTRAKLNMWDNAGGSTGFLISELSSTGDLFFTCDYTAV